MMQWPRYIVLSSAILWIGIGCESESDVTSDGESGGTNTGAGASVVTSDPGGASDPVFNGVTWLHADVSAWKQTAKLGASVTSDKVVLDYDKVRVWPAVENVNASAWVIFTLNGKVYASTFDYLRPGQTAKERNFYIPVGGTRWQPSSGEKVGFMVSGLARDSRRNVYERSNLDYTTWP